MFNVYNSGNPADDAANRQRDLIAQIMAAQAAGVSLPQYQQGLGQSPILQIDEVTSDPATEGGLSSPGLSGTFGGIGLGALGGAVTGLGFGNDVAASVAQQGDVAAPGSVDPGTGLGMAVTGYESSFGAPAPDNNGPAPGPAIANDIAGPITDTSMSVNDIAAGYNSDPSGFGAPTGTPDGSLGGLGGFGGISGGNVGGGLGAGLSGDGVSGGFSSGPGGDGTTGANSGEGGPGGGGGGGGGSK